MSTVLSRRVLLSIRRKQEHPQGIIMAQYLVPCSGFLVVEAASRQHAEIMALTWGQSLLRRRTGSHSIQNRMTLEGSQSNVRETTSGEVKATSMKFDHNKITDITSEIESYRQQAIEKD